MCKRTLFVRAMVISSMVSVAIASSSSWQKGDPAQWASEDVYEILNNSPWSKSVKVTTARAAGYGDQGSGNGGNGGTWGSGGQMPGGGMGRMGGGGMGGGGMGRGHGNRGSQPTEQTTATVQWASALPVRLAEAKMSGGSVDPAAMKPLNEYVIAVVGLPKSGLVSQTSGSSGDDSDDAALADHLKVITVLAVGHERLNPTKVDLNQGRDARTVFHFEKSEPITVQDKDAEFRITANRMELKKKFALKDMEYQGKLEL